MATALERRVTRLESDDDGKGICGLAASLEQFRHRNGYRHQPETAAALAARLADLEAQAATARCPSPTLVGLIGMMRARLRLNEGAKP